MYSSVVTSVLFLFLTDSSLSTIANTFTRSDMTLQPSRDTPDSAQDVASTFTQLSNMALLPSRETPDTTENEHFPRILHFLWPNKDFSYGADDPDGIEQRRTQELVNRIKRNNPEWQVRIWSDDECFALGKWIHVLLSKDSVCGVPYVVDSPCFSEARLSRIL